MKNIFIKAAIGVLAILGTAVPMFGHFGSKGPYGGRVSTAIHQGSVAYIGSPTGGVYESTDSTLNTWRARLVGLKCGNITALAHTGSYLFAATADSGIFIFNGYSNTDRYWIKKNTGLGTLEINCLLAIDSVTLMAGTNGAEGIYITRDKGETWTKANGPSMHHFQITGLVKIGNRIIQAALDGGAWYSDDLGNTWTTYNDDNTLHIEGTNALSYNESTKELLICNVNGIYKTTVALSDATPVYSLATKGLPSSAQVRSLCNDGSYWYLATNKGVFISPANSISWAAQNTGLGSLDVHTVCALKSFLIAGTTKGIFKSEKVGSPTWTETNTGYNNIRLLAGTTKGTDIAVVATENGVWLSKNVTAAKAVYSAANKGLHDSTQVTQLLFAENVLVAATRSAGVFLSIDTANTWTHAGLESLHIAKLWYLHHSVYAATSQGTLYSATAPFTSWTPEQYDLPAGAKVIALTSFGNKLVASTSTNGVFTKALQASSWQATQAGLPNTPVLSLCSQGPKLFAGTAGAGVYIADTATISWAPTSTIANPHITLVGLDAKNISDLAVHDKFVFASYKGGLVASADQGSTWQQAGTQFNLPSYSDIGHISFTEGLGSVAGRVFVTTEHNSFYSNSLSELKTDINYVDDTYLSTDICIAPNPNEGIFTVLGANFLDTDIKATDIYGKVWPVKLGSSGTLMLNAPAGTYIIHIKKSTSVQMAKMILK